MPLTRWIVSVRNQESVPVRDAIVNTLYFNVSGQVGQDPDYTTLGNDLWTLWAGRQWALGRFVDVRGYSMDDPEPRQQRYIKRAMASGSPAGTGPGQIALALSYYADRNLPRQRGRIFIGPWTPSSTNASSAQVAAVMTLPPLLSALGGINVDWSLYSPTKGTGTRITNAWCDDSWDVIRSRKLPSLAARSTWTGNG
jgi:hypothetical protein